MNQSFGKFIISGEHSVVFGEPAIVCELKKSITVQILKSDQNIKQSDYERFIFDLFSKKYKLDILNLTVKKVESNLPQKSGLGSSAAYAHAVLKGLVSFFKIKVTKDEMFELVYDSEVFIHKNPSGIDPFAVVYGGNHLFRKNLKTNEFENEKIISSKQYDFLLINSGQASESTGEMVSLVANLVKIDPSKKAIINKIGEITNIIKTQLVDGTFTGDLLNQNQLELEKLNIVGNKAKEIIKEIQENEAFAKITGAGGVKSGSGWILVYAKNLTTVEELCRQNTWEYIKTKVK